MAGDVTAVNNGGPDLLQLAGIRVRATSVAGLETCIELPDLKLCFDMGRASPSAIRHGTVLFTHSHMDHMGGIAQHAATRELQGMDPPTYVMPAVAVDPVQQLFAAWRGLNGSEPKAQLIGARPGDSIALDNGRVARPLQAFHPVACQGYAIVEQRKRLLPKFVGAQGSVIKAAREAGETINETVEHTIVVFSGDTTAEFHEHNELAQTAQLLITEVTFMDERISVASARKHGHTHLDEIIERAETFKNQAILFTHLSARYKQEEALAVLAQRLPASLKDRVTLLPRPAWCA